MKPTSPDPRLQAYLDGELSVAEQAQLSAELAESEPLRAELERLQAANQLARQGAAPEPPADHAERIQAMIADRPQRWWERLLPAPGRSTPLLAWGVASTAMLAAVLYPYTDLTMARLHRDVYVTVNDAMTTATDGGGTSYLVKPTKLQRDAEAASGGRSLFGSAREKARRSAPAAAGRPAVEAASADTAMSVMDADVLATEGLVERKPTERAARTTLESESRVVERSAALSQAQPAARLKAGEVDDNEAYAKYVERADGPLNLPDLAPLNLRQRYMIQVVDGRGRGLAGRQVVLDLAGQQLRQPPLARLRTDTSGQAVFFGDEQLPSELSLTVLPATTRGSQLTATVRTRTGGDTWRMVDRSGKQSTTGLPLDIVFVLDVTGSMSEEIASLRETIDEVAARINELPAQPKLRFGMVLYRDRGDDFLTKVIPFTSEVEAFRQRLAQVEADGGGDTAEDVCAALETLVSLPWEQGQRSDEAIRLAFLIGDAPPHLDYANQTPYLQSLRRAAELGVKIFGVATSGLDDLGEAVWRQAALLTRGRFLFITKRDAAQSTPQQPVYTTPHHVEAQDYTVKALPELILNDVARELAQLGQQTPEAPRVELPPAPSTPEPVVEPPVVYEPPVAPVIEPVERHGLPLWATLLVLLLNALGWFSAWRRSQRPLAVRPYLRGPRWTPPADGDDDEA